MLNGGMGKSVQKWIACCLILGNIKILTMAATIARSDTNLTSILWAHAVNSQKLLDEALAGKIDMIEADIVLGTLENDTSGQQIPVMGHPPANVSDITLETFLTKILDYNTLNPDRQKGVKLDFKSTVVYEGSIGILNSLWKRMTYPVWLNADILPGPVNPTSIPVDANFFLSASKNFSSAVLSVGWTTQWGPSFSEGAYNRSHVDAMIGAIQGNNITGSKHEITFPVRAGIAAQSLSELQRLYSSLNGTNKLTLTIWSSAGDRVDIEKLRELIFDFGVDKVYLDVPEEVSSKLDLGRNGASSLWPSLLKFSFMNLAMFFVTQILSTRN